MGWFCGIDYSLSSPAMTFFDPTTEEYECVFFHSKQVNEKHSTILFKSFLFSLLENKALYEKIITIADLFIEQIKKKDITLIGVESYSLGSVGRFTSIIENLGYLKVSLVKSGLSFIELAPTTIKKGFSGSGRASKEEMVLQFEKKTTLNLYEILSLNKSLKNIPKPITDIVDSFAISQELYKRYGQI